MKDLKRLFILVWAIASFLWLMVVGTDIAKKTLFSDAQMAQTTEEISLIAAAQLLGPPILLLIVGIMALWVISGIRKKGGLD